MNITLPDDAGEHADALRCILEHFGEGWPHRLSCGPGWYPILNELQARLSAIDPGYEVQQVKEKFGTLRFYWSWSEDASDEAIKAGEEVVSEAERLSATTCEVCGSGEGERVTRNGFWMKTLCPRCAA